MNVVVIGGSGRVGARVVTEIRQHADFELVVADQNPPRDPQVKFLKLDLSDPESLRSVLEGADVVVNTSGPFDRWGTVVLDAAIETGVDYIDVCDDPLPTIELLKRDEAARNAGVRAVVGLGVSPGMTNFLAVIAGRHLDDVDLLATFWGNPREGMDLQQATEHAHGLAEAFRGGRAAYTHLITQTSSQVPVWREGALVNERAWKAAYRVNTSQGETGIYRVIGHPEPVTVPHVVRTRACLNIGTVDAGTDRLMLPFLDRVADGELTSNDALNLIADALAECPQHLVTELIGKSLPRLIGAAAIGKSGGKSDGVVVFPGGSVDGSMSLETARPAVVGVLHLSDIPTGVHAPEKAFDADAFMTHYSKLFWDGGVPYVVDRPGPNALVEMER